MRPLTASEVLQVWEEATSQTQFEKPLRLLAVACSVNDLNQLSHLSIGERDARLLQLREWMFGSTLRNKVNCPKCSETVEWEADTKDLHLQSFPQALSIRKFFLEKDGYKVDFRLPDSMDVSKLISDKLNQSNSKKLLLGCILKIIKDDKERLLDDLPEAIFEVLNERMSKEDPQADIRMSLTCPACDHHWNAHFDIASYLWTEINNWAQRMLQEIYLLARAFGWSEKDILNMSPYRRQFYIGMLGR